jgi:hypothetical protein
MVYLTRVWGYRTDIWHKPGPPPPPAPAAAARNAAKRKRSAAAAARRGGGSGSGSGSEEEEEEACGGGARFCGAGGGGMSPAERAAAANADAEDAEWRAALAQAASGSHAGAAVFAAAATTTAAFTTPGCTSRPLLQQHVAWGAAAPLPAHWVAPPCGATSGSGVSGGGGGGGSSGCSALTCATGGASADASAAGAVDALRALVRGSLMPLARDVTCAWAGEQTLAAAQAHLCRAAAAATAAAAAAAGDAALADDGMRAASAATAAACVSRLAANAQSLRCLRRVTTWVGQQHALVRGWRAQLATGAPDASTAAAWAHLRGTEGPMEATLRALLQVLSAGEADAARTCAAAAAATAPFAAASPPFAELLRVWEGELDAGVSGTLRWVAHAQAASAALRISSFDAYLEASELILELAFGYMTATVAAFTHRRAWMCALAGVAGEEAAEAAAAAAPGATPLHEVCPALTRAVMPHGAPPPPPPCHVKYADEYECAAAAWPAEPAVPLACCWAAAAIADEAPHAHTTPYAGAYAAAAVAAATTTPCGGVNSAVPGWGEAERWMST